MANIPYKTFYDLPNTTTPLTATELNNIQVSIKDDLDGKATLDLSGKVPSSQLPSYVDDVIEGYYYNGGFYEESTHTTPITGETGKIYVSIDTSITYRWSGSAFIEIQNGAGVTVYTTYNTSTTDTYSCSYINSTVGDIETLLSQI